MHRLTMRKLAMGLALAATLTVPTWAQSTTQGAVSGTVTDATGAVVPNANVLIHNDGTGADLNLTTDSSGFYKAPQLQPGTYTVTVKSAGFGELVSKGVVVQVQSVTEVSPRLVAGATESTVEVTAEVPVLKFDTPEFGGHLDTQEIENIPINNRRWSSLALTTPGVTNDASGFGLLSFRAISAVLNNVQIDGADDNQGFYGEERGRTRAGYSTSQAAVREFQVNTGVYSAEFGRAVGGVVNSVTKNGTNAIHGEAYFYNRNSSRSAFVPGATNTVFDASRPVGQQYVTTPYRPKDNRNQYGFGVGGPLIKDKLFWFYAFDEYRRNFPGTAKANNPATFFLTPDATLPTGQTCNFTDVSYTPAGGKTTTYAAGSITTGSGATLAAAGSSQNNQACLLAARLFPNYTAGAAAYNAQLQALLGVLGPVPRYGNQDINTPKLDWQVNNKHHVSVLYHRLRWDSPGGVQTQGTNNYAVDTFGTDFVKLDYGVAKLNSIFSDHFVNELRYQYGRELNYEGNQPKTAYTNTNLVNNAQGAGSAPEIALNTGVGFFFGQPYYGFRIAYPDERKWQVGDTANFMFGKHNIRFGTDIVHNYDFQNNLYEGNGYINYTSNANYFSDLLSRGNANGGKSCNASGSSVGNYPCYSFFAQGFGPTTFQLSTTDMGFFVQDDWKAMRGLTVNLGVRYDYEMLPAPFAGLNGTAAGTLAITSNHPQDKNNIAPRVGFAYDPFGAGKTVVRGGFGMYFGRIPNAVLLNAYENTGSPLSQSTPSYTTSNTSAANLPTIFNPPTGPAPGTRTAYYLDKNFQNPYTEQFDLAVQQVLGFNNVLSVQYLGALGRNLPNFINANLDPAHTYQIPYTIKAGTDGTCGPLACGSTYNVTAYAGRQITSVALSNPTTATATGYTTFGAVDPTFGSVTDVLSNINSNYHALSVNVTNRSNRWIKFDANYTWSHALDFSQNQFTAASVNNFIDPFANPRLNYGTSSLDVRHRAVGWMIFNIPGTKGHDWLAQVTKGWSIKPLVQIQSGLPYSAVSNGTTPQSCYASVASGAAVGVGCFLPMGTGIAGTSSSASYLPFLGRNTFQYPRTILIDARVQKDFGIFEKYTVQLIGEAFNIGNHRNVTGVTTTAYNISTSQTGNAATTTNSLTYQPSFGAVSSANSNYAYGPRVIQIAARFVF